MDSIARGLINPYVLIYGVAIIATQLFYSQWQRRRRALVERQRRTRGLSNDVLLSRPERLAARREYAFVESALLLLMALGLPFVLAAAIPFIEGSAESVSSSRLGLTMALLGSMLVLVWSARKPLQAFVGGLAFKLLAVSTVPFEIGDRITVKGITGRVTQLGTFLLEIETAAGERVSLPAYLLWTEMVAIAPERATRCEIALQLSLSVSQRQRRLIESFLQESVQSSTYIAPSKPIQIYFSMVPLKLQIVVVAYATAEEQAMAFKSEITNAFLTFAEKEQIAL